MTYNRLAHGYDFVAADHVCGAARIQFFLGHCVAAIRSHARHISFSGADHVMVGALLDLEIVVQSRLCRYFFVAHTGSWIRVLLHWHWLGVLLRQRYRIELILTLD